MENVLNEFVEYQKFSDLDEASGLISWLNENNIGFEIENHGQGYSLVTDPLDNYLIIKIPKEEFDTVNRLYLSVNQDTNAVNIDHYLFTFSDEDILDVIANPSDWSQDEVQIATVIAGQRKLEVSHSILVAAKKKKIESIVEEEHVINNNIRNNANWFLIIAVLSFINTLVLFLKIDFRLIFGLGITQLIDSILFRIYGELSYYNLIVSAGISFIFTILWIKAREAKKWAFISGIVIYSLDTLLFLFIQDWLSVGFHVFVVIGIITGYLSMSDKVKIKE